MSYKYFWLGENKEFTQRVLGLLDSNKIVYCYPAQSIPKSVLFTVQSVVPFLPAKNVFDSILSAEEKYTVAISDAIKYSLLSSNLVEELNALVR